MRSNYSLHCFYSTNAKYIVTVWFGVYLLFLPLFLYVLYIGFKRCRNWRSAFVSSHSDVITFHMVALELCCMVFSALYCDGFYSGPTVWAQVGENAVSLCLLGQALFHCLTCAERYLAVVQPITYLRLKKKGGVTIRNIGIGCVWLLSLGHTNLSNIDAIKPFYDIAVAFTLGVFTLAVVGFCSVSVISVLMRPGPGERGGDRRILDQSKRSALETVATILAVLLLRFVAFLVANTLIFLPRFDADLCPIALGWLWFGLPSSLVLPLLFLRQARKLKS